MPSSSKNGASKSLVAEIDWKAPACEPGKCRINCRRNPNCFSQLGEKFWFNPIKESFWVKAEDPENERKDENGHVGLKNLGATCYVNTFLQLWFTNKPLCSAVYQWRSDTPPTEIMNEASEGESQTISLSFDDSTKAICGNLQYLFTLLQYSERRYVDPSAFVESLGLQTNEQQDAQEFNKLFISLLDSSLLAQGINIIDQQFGGTYCYRTQCNECGAISDRPSKFYELDLSIKGHSSLRKCLQEFLKEEVLEGDNKYFCSNCQEKRNATRKIVLQKLPRVLNLQLLRFVFDRLTFTKKKLNNVIEFPDTLDMNEFVKLENKDDGIYKLTAVLIHRGLSANSGHYIAHIWDKENDVWCRFNDEDVQVMKSKTLELGKEEDLEGAIDSKSKGKEKDNKTKKSVEKDVHRSKNSYTLVYSKVDNQSEDIVEPPDHMMEIVAKDNSLFEQWVSDVSNTRSEALAKGIRKQTDIQAIYACLTAQEGEDYDWISTKWLRKWLSNDHATVPPIDNTELMCPHSLADPSKMTLMKRVSGEAADILYEKYGGLPRFKSDGMCSKCMDFLKKQKEFFAKLNEDIKIFSKCLKQNYSPTGELFWVGKKSLKQIKQLATQEFMWSFDFNPANTASTSSINASTNENGDASNNNNNNNNDSSQEVTDEQISSSPMVLKKSNLSVFNQDIVCQEHGNLSLNDGLRTLISKEDWLKCIKYFPSAKEFPSSTSACSKCQAIRQSNEEEKVLGKQIAAEQKQYLSFLNGNYVERTQNFLSRQNATLHVIPIDFITTWRKGIKTGKTISEPIDNKDMICEHDLSLYNAEEIIDEVLKHDPDIMFVDDEERRKLEPYFEFLSDVSISMIKITKEDDENTQETIYESKPAYCAECRSLRLAEEAFDSQSYENVPIYVQKLTETQHNYTVDESKKAKNDEETDPDNIVVEEDKPLKNQKRDNTSSTEFIPTKKAKLSDLEDLNKRRSSRHRRKRGEYAIYVNSDQTLKQLKVQLLNIFSIFPLEQVLSFEDGVVLLEDDKQLVDLGIRPGMHLFLSVAETTEDQISQIDQGKERVLEAGFKGTNLLCGGK